MAFSLLRRATKACRRRQSLARPQTRRRALLLIRGPCNKQRVHKRSKKRTKGLLNERAEQVSRRGASRHETASRKTCFWLEAFTWRVSQVARWGLSWLWQWLYGKVCPAHPSRPPRNIHRRTDLPLCRWRRSIRIKVTLSTRQA